MAGDTIQPADHNEASASMRLSDSKQPATCVPPVAGRPYYEYRECDGPGTGACLHSLRESLVDAVGVCHKMHSSETLIKHPEPAVVRRGLLMENN